MGCLFTSSSEVSKFNSETNIDHISHDLRQSWSSSASFTSSTESQWYVHSSYQLKNNEKYCWLGVYATICIRTLSSLCYISYWLRWTVIPDCRFTSLRLTLADLSSVSFVSFDKWYWQDEAEENMCKDCYSRDCQVCHCRSNQKQQCKPWHHDSTAPIMRVKSTPQLYKVIIYK